MVLYKSMLWQTLWDFKALYYKTIQKGVMNYKIFALDCLFRLKQNFPYSGSREIL